MVTKTTTQNWKVEVTKTEMPQVSIAKCYLADGTTYKTVFVYKDETIKGLYRYGFTVEEAKNSGSSWGTAIKDGWSIARFAGTLW